MVSSLALMILAVLPFLFLGAALLLVKDAGAIPAQLLDSPRLQQAGATPGLLITEMHLAGGLVSSIGALDTLSLFASPSWSWVRSRSCSAPV